MNWSCPSPVWLKQIENGQLCAVRSFTNGHIAYRDFYKVFIPAQNSMSDRKVVHMVVVKGQKTFTSFNYRSGMVNSNTVNSKFHSIRSFCELFHV